MLHMRKHGTVEEEVGEEKQEIKRITWVWRGKCQRWKFKSILKFNFAFNLVAKMF